MLKQLPKKLVLDAEKWRCGCSSKPGVNSLGKGETLLLNFDGYQCCLGQFMSQCEVSDDKLSGMSMPSSVNIPIMGLTLEKEGMFGGKYTPDSRLSTKCANINDDKETTIHTKIKLIREALEKTGRTLVVKNLNKVLKKKKKK